MKTRNTSGFTLLELMVAIGVFSILLIILIGIFSRFTFIQRRDIAEQKLIEDLRFAVEVFNREARTAYGSTYALTDSRGHGLVMRNQNGACVHFRFFDGLLQRSEQPGITGDCSLDDFSNAAYATVVSSGIEFEESLRFEAVPAEVVAGRLVSQGFTTIALKARPKDIDIAPVTIQSTVASRQVVPFSPL